MVQKLKPHDHRLCFHFAKWACHFGWSSGRLTYPFILYQNEDTVLLYKNECLSIWSWTNSAKSITTLSLPLKNQYSCESPCLILSSNQKGYQMYQLIIFNSIKKYRKCYIEWQGWYEAHFHLEYVNKLNCRISDLENPHVVLQIKMHPLQVIVFGALVKRSHQWPSFLWKWKQSIHYSQWSHQSHHDNRFFVPALHVIDVNVVWFQYDGSFNLPHMSYHIIWSHIDW